MARRAQKTNKTHPGNMRARVLYPDLRTSNLPRELNYACVYVVCTHNDKKNDITVNTSKENVLRLVSNEFHKQLFPSLTSQRFV